MRYIFISIGKKRIAKAVDFRPLKTNNFVNLSFGDLLPNGSIDDSISSNNGDIVKVLATVVDILKHFTTQHPETLIFFAGSSDERTKLYTRILKTYYIPFGKEYAIYGIINMGEYYETVPFDPKSDLDYLAFVIKKNN